MTQHILSACNLTQPITLSNEFRILPAGRFKAADGRPGEGRYWNLSEATGQRMVAEAASRKQDYLIDYEHQSLSGQQAPAAGWFNTLIWKTDGLYVQAAKWTDAAKTMIVNKEYRFISPVFTFDEKTGELNKLVSIALTNNPALPELTDLSNVALTQQGLQSVNVQDNGLQGRSLEVFNHVFPELKTQSNAALTQIEALNAATLKDKDRHNLERLIGQPLTGQQTTLTSASAIQDKPQVSHQLQGRSLEVFKHVFPELSR